MNPAPSTPGPGAQIDTTPRALAELRARIESLLGQIDTGRKPLPDCYTPKGRRLPGPAWKPLKHWVIRALEDGDSADCIYVHTHLDWRGDMTALRLDEARRLAMALLAACDWADGTSRPTGIYPQWDEDEEPVGGFICER